MECGLRCRFDDDKLEPKRPTTPQYIFTLVIFKCSSSRTSRDDSLPSGLFCDYQNVTNNKWPAIIRNDNKWLAIKQCAAVISEMSRIMCVLGWIN
jgi:hypothetical protein